MSDPTRPDADPALLWTEERTRRLGELADVLLPGGAGMPAATEAAVPTTGVQRVFEARQDLSPALAAVVDASSGLDPVDVLTRLHQEDPRGWTVFTTCVAAAYYMTPAVRRLLGYGGQEGVLINSDDFFGWASTGLLDPVLERGPIGRSTPARPHPSADQGAP
jgi:hypothetical protein